MNASKAPRNQGGSPPDDGVIDLTNPIPSPFEDDAPIIELTHRVNTAAGNGVARPPAEDPAPAPLDPQPEQRLPDLEDERIPIDLLDDAIVFDDAEDSTGGPDDFVDSLGLEIASAAEDLSTPSPDPDLEARVASALPPEKIEAALERVIERIYAEKLEGILVETVERVVKREIEEIQSTLLGDGEP
jgi:hypothetical protein